MDIVASSIVFASGLICGSLLNVLIVRVPREGNIGGWPCCTRCGHALKIWQLLPLVGWLIQGGRGRCCNKRLDWIFPLIELLAGVAAVVLYLRYGLSILFFYMSFVTAVLLLTGAIDWLHRSIYTLFILGPAFLVLLAALTIHLGNYRFLNALIGAFAGGFTFAILFVLARFLFPAKAAPFGLGDVYLAIFIGAAIGITNLMPALFYGILLAGIFAAVLVTLRHTGHPNVPEYISYGTFLCLGTLVYLLLGRLQGI